MTLSIILIFVVQFNLRIRALIMAHKFSIGFKSDEFPGQSNNLNFSIHKNDFVTMELWKGAKSCWNTPSPSGNLLRMVGISLVLSTSMYFVLFIIPSIGWRVSGPKSVKQPQNMTFGGGLGACWRFLRWAPNEIWSVYLYFKMGLVWKSHFYPAFIFFAQDSLFFFIRGVEFFLGRTPCPAATFQRTAAYSGSVYVNFIKYNISFYVTAGLLWVHNADSSD